MKRGTRMRRLRKICCFRAVGVKRELNECFLDNRSVSGSV